MTEDAKTMLRLLGCPVVEAPCEAEAQCAELVKLGKCFATATEDMDALTFKTDYLLRGFNSKKEPISEISYGEMMKGLELTYEQFVDLCILCGCDYTDTIDGIGPVTAYKMIKEHGTIENVIKSIEKSNDDPKKKKKYVVPTEFHYEDARDLFIKAEVDKDITHFDFKWNKPNEEEMKKFLCEEKGFAEVRVENAVKKMKSAVETKGNQSRLESFFGKPTIVKRKENPVAEKSAGKGSGKSAKVGGKK